MGRVKGAKNKNGKELNREKWLMLHPEDITIDRENQESRLRGWDDNGTRALFAAIAMQTCVDFKRATEPSKKYTEEYQHDERVDCMKAFSEDHFQYLLNGMKPTDIAERIVNTPKEYLRGIMYAGNNDTAKNTTPIIEE